MKRRRFLILTIVASLAWVACQGNRAKPRPIPHYTVVVTGSTDASYTGTFSVDGVLQPVSGKGMNSWSFQCNELVCWFRQGAEHGLLEFEIRTQSGKMRAVSAPGAGGECRLIGRNGKVEARTSLKRIETAPAG